MSARSRPRLSAIAWAIVVSACASAPAGAPEALRVMTYNIHAGKDAVQQHNLARVAEVIRSARADIVLLQEVDRGTQRSAGEDQVATLEKLTGMHVVFGKSLDYQGGDYGIALVSRFPLDSVRVVPLEIQPPLPRSAGVYEPRIGLHAIVRTPRGAVHVVNTHVDAAAAQTYRHQEIMGLLAHIARTVPANAMLIFGGDLNARPDTPEIAALSLAFTDSFGQCGTGTGMSYPASAPDRRIDYLWLRGARCTSVQILDTQASDHRPLLAIVNPIFPRD